jgi:hypothetical protein
VKNAAEKCSADMASPEVGLGHTFIAQLTTVTGLKKSERQKRRGAGRKTIKSQLNKPSCNHELQWQLQ